MPALLPLNFKAWIEENRSQLKPPVGNKLVREDREFIIMVVGGPNSRTDYHINAGEEFFYQVEGDTVVRVIEDGKSKDVPIKRGRDLSSAAQCAALTAPANTVGLVIERKRQEGEQDGFVWLFAKKLRRKAV